MYMYVYFPRSTLQASVPEPVSRPDGLPGTHPLPSAVRHHGGDVCRASGNGPAQRPGPDGPPLPELYLHAIRRHTQHVRAL